MAAGTALGAERTVELRSPRERLQATFAPRAGMLGWSLWHRGEELLGHPVGLAEHVATGEPTGVALLHPWANRLSSPQYEVAGRDVMLDLQAPNVHTDEHGLPIHGLAAGSPRWEVLDEGPSQVRARLDWTAWPELTAGFPFAHMLHLCARLTDERLEFTTHMVATVGDPVPVAFGFHPYLRLPGVDRADWHVTLPVRSRMALDARMLPTGRSEPVDVPPGPLGDRTYDDAFDGLADPVEFVLAGGGRRLSVAFGEGYRFAQVYAPPGEAFIAFEPMTAPIDPFISERTMILAPGDRYRACFAITVREAGA
jgi:aldose 1-epimerase